MHSGAKLAPQEDCSTNSTNQASRMNWRGWNSLYVHEQSKGRQSAQPDRHIVYRVLPACYRPLMHMRYHYPRSQLLMGPGKQVPVLALLPLMSVTLNSTYRPIGSTLTRTTLVTMGDVCMQMTLWLHSCANCMLQDHQSQQTSSSASSRTLAAAL